MPNTTAGGLPYPIPSDPVESWPATAQALALKLEAHRGRLTRATLQSIPNNAQTTFDATASSDLVGITADLAANTLTIARAGLYLISAGTDWASNSTGRRIVFLIRNGGVLARQTSGGQAAMGQTVSRPEPLAAGDVIRADFFQDNTGVTALDTLAGTQFLSVVHLA